MICQSLTVTPKNSQPQHFLGYVVDYRGGRLPDVKVLLDGVEAGTVGLADGV